MTNDSSKKTKLILIGHGSRSPNWRKPLDARVHELQKSLGEDQVGVAFMEWNQPTLAEAIAIGLAEGVQRFWVLPMFLSSGGHVERDIESEIQRLRVEHNQIDMCLMDSFGEQPIVTAALHTLVKLQLDSQ